MKYKNQIQNIFFNRFRNKNLFQFSFFNKQISEKYGQKCCRYNQNGKPLDRKTVQNVYDANIEFLKDWKISDDYLQLYRYYFTEDYPMAVQFIKDVAKMDVLTTKNCPSFHLTKGEILKIELYSPPISGLSSLDFQLAIQIANMKIDEYFLIPIDDISNYKNEVQMKRFQKQSDKIQQQLREQQGNL